MEAALFDSEKTVADSPNLQQANSNPLAEPLSTNSAQQLAP